MINIMKRGDTGGRARIPQCSLIAFLSPVKAGALDRENLGCPECQVRGYYSGQCAYCAASAVIALAFASGKSK